MWVQRSSLALLAVAMLSGCARNNPVGVADLPLGSTGSDSYTFVVQSPDDPRLPAPGAEEMGASEADRAALSAIREPERGAAGTDPAVYWNQYTTTLGKAAKLPPPLFARDYALVQVGIYDALLVSKHRGHGGPLDDAVAAGVADEVLSYLFPAEAANVRAAALAQAGRVGHGRRLGAWHFGQAVGRLVVKHGQSDGSDAVFTGTTPTGPGIWTGVNPVLPMCGTWKCWFARSGDEFQPEPPYAYGSAQDLAEVDEVYQVSLHRTGEQIAIVHKWADLPPPTIWNGIIIANIGSHGLDHLASARVLAFANATMHDAFVSCWFAKYKYWTARPFQRIDGLVTVIPTPNFPTYTSGHSTISGAVATVLGAFFPDEATYFGDQADEAAVSRLYGGIHFQHDNDEGLRVGRLIGAKVVQVLNGNLGSHKIGLS